MADKRAAVNANRRVANMTSSQIESKRSIDRANQRHCRAKQRTQLGRLQAQVDVLERELEDARRQLRESLERERAWVGVLAGGGGVLVEGGGDGVSGGGVGEYGVDGDLDALQQPAASQLSCSTTAVTSTLNSYSPFDINLAIANPTWPPAIPSPSRPLPWTDHFTLDKFSTPLTPTAWNCIPPLVAPTTQLDQVILSTTETLRLRGFHSAARRSSPFPSISSLLGPTAAPPACDISAAAAAQVGRSPVASLLARVGFMYVLSHLLRWYVCRTRETYEQLPACIRPTALQRAVPHPPWIDVIVWPDVRDAIIQHMDWSRFLELRAVTAGSLCVGWPRTDTRAVFECVDGKNYRLSGVFEQHLRDSANWTVGAGADEVFPFLKPVCRRAP